MIVIAFRIEKYIIILDSVPPLTHLTSYTPSKSKLFILIITRGWHNRPGVVAVPIASQDRIKKKIEIMVVLLSRNT
jgi:hypothetical protein